LKSWEDEKLGRYGAWRKGRGAANRRKKTEDRKQAEGGKVGGI
jgi:hypothetical protein